MTGRNDAPVRLNVTFLLLMTATVAATGGAVFALHALQTGRSTALLKGRAEMLQKQGEHFRALSCWEKYLRLAPTDVEAVIAKGELTERVAKTPQHYLAAFLDFERALRLNARLDHIRRRAAQLALRLGRYSDAHDHLARLVEAGRDDPELLFLLGQALEGMKEFAQAADYYDKSVEASTQNVDAYARLAYLRRRLQQPEPADEAIRAMVKANADSAEAHLAQAAYLEEFGFPPDAVIAAAQRAERLERNNAEAILLTARALLRSGTKDSANDALHDVRVRLTKGIGKHPEDLRFHQLLAELELLAREPDAAIRAVREGLKASPDWEIGRWLLGDLLISQQRLKEAREALGQLRQMNASPTLTDYLQGRLQLAAGEWLGASRTLKRVAAKSQDDPRVALRARLYLAEAYGRIGRSAQQIREYRRVLREDRTSVAARLGLAAALRGAGRWDEAIGIYRQLVALPQVSLQLAAVQLEKNLRAAESEQDWPSFYQAIDAAAKLSPDAPEIALLRAEAHLATDQRKEAIDLVQEVIETRPGEAKTWAAASQLALRAGESSLAADILRQGMEMVGDNAHLRAALIAYWSGSQEAEVGRKLDQFEEDIERFTHDECVQLWVALAAARERIGDLPAAVRCWQSAAELWPDATQLRLQVFTLARSLRDSEAMREARHGLIRIEGPEGPNVLAAELLTEMDEADDGSKPIVTERAGDLFDRLRASQSNSPLVCRAQGQFLELEGNLPEAIGSYRRALDQGDRDGNVIRRLVNLYMSQGDYAEAQHLVERLRRMAPASVHPNLRQISSRIAWHREDLVEAVRQAREAIAEGKNRSADYLWLGHLLAAANEKAEAQRALETAIELAPEQPAPWIVLVRFLVSHGEEEEAVKWIERARAALPENVAELALGHCFEAMGNAGEADNSFGRALSRGLDNTWAVYAAAGYYLRHGRIGEAEPLLKRLVSEEKTPVGVAAWARRNLALRTSARDYEHFRQALAYLDQNIRSWRHAVTDERIKARLLASVPYPLHLRQAVDVLCDLKERGQLTADDRALLAQLHDRLGEGHRAGEHWRKLVEVPDATPTHLALFLRRQIERNESDDVEKGLAVLEAKRPGDFASFELRARWLARQTDAPAIVERLRQYVAGAHVSSDEPDEMARMEQAAVLLSDLGKAWRGDQKGRRQLLDQAERWLRRLAADGAEQQLTLAVHLGRRGDVAGALELCEQAAQSPQQQFAAAVTAATVVRSGSASEAQIEQVGRMLQSLPESAGALFQLASFREFEERYDEAEAIYWRMLQTDENNVAALNNLALLLMRKGRHSEAAELIARAIKIAGPNSALLDSRGTIRLSAGRTSEAIQDYLDAIAQLDLPTRRFHLALAYHQAGRAAAAKLQWSMAHKAGLKPSQLQPHEVANYEALRQDFTQ